MTIRKYVDLGARIFGFAMACFGVHNLCFITHLTSAAPGPPWGPQNTFIYLIVGIALLVCGLAIGTNQRRTIASRALATLILLQILIFALPALIAHIHSPDSWTNFAELLALGGVSLVLAVTPSTEHLPSTTSTPTARRGQSTGRLLFAASLVVFAIQHFMYARFVAYLVPAWIPAHLFFAYFVGVVFVAATLSITSRYIDQLALILLGGMFLVWLIILHIPRIVAANAHNGSEWTSAFIALAMCGGAWAVVTHDQS